MVLVQPSELPLSTCPLLSCSLRLHHVMGWLLVFVVIGWIWLGFTNATKRKKSLCEPHESSSPYSPRSVAIGFT